MNAQLLRLGGGVSLVYAAALGFAFACARVPPAPRDAATPPEKTPSAPARTPGPRSAAGPLAVPADPAPSGILYAVGLKSDLPELTHGPPGRRWIVAAGGRAEILRGPLRMKPEGRRAVSFQVQVGAFSQEEPARQLVERLSRELETAGAVAFSADRGVYRALLGSFPDRAAAEAFAAKVRAAGSDAFAVEGSAAPAEGPATISITGEDGVFRRLPSPVGVYAAPADGPVLWDTKPYRGSLRIAVNPRGTLNVVNRLDLEEYLYGVIPAEMGPKRYDELEALKAQAVAARTYAMAHRRQFDGEGYDLCATPKCQVYSGLSAEDPLSNAAVDATRGLVLGFQGRFADALFISTCGGRTENVENVFGETPVPYLVSVDCGELATTVLPGASLDRRAPARDRSGLQFRGYVLSRHAGRRRVSRSALVETAQRLAGFPAGGVPPPATLSPAAVYPSIVAAFALGSARAVHLENREEAYYSEAPAVSGRLSGSAREAYDLLVRLRFGGGEPLPAADRALDEEEYGGLLFSAALRLSGVAEGAGRFLRREGANVWVKTAEGRQGLPVDPELPLARRLGDRFLAAGSLILRPGDRLRWWKRGPELLAVWVEVDAAGPTFERESSWTEWVRRVSGRELARRMAGRVAGTEVRDIAVVRRSDAGRVTEIRVVTDAAEATFKRFDLRQALELPETLFTVQKARGPQDEIEFLFLGRGWGHGVGMCQNGAYGMALAGSAYDEILRHYYTGVEIVPGNTLSAAAPSTR